MKIATLSKLVFALGTIGLSTFAKADIQATCSFHGVRLTSAADGFTPVYGVKLDCPFTNSTSDFDKKEYNAFVWELNLDRAKQINSLKAAKRKACVTIDSTYWGTIKDVSLDSCECTSDDYTVKCDEK